MCGRYQLHASFDELEELFDTILMPAFSPRYNIAPTQTVLTIRLNSAGNRIGVMQHWGLIPAASFDRKSASKLINARSETASTKSTFREAFQSRRCLIPANGFFEWPTRTSPVHVHRKDRQVFAMAGLWELWLNAGNHVESCTILTTQANHFLADVHERMPVILDPELYARWLDPTQSTTQLQHLLKPCPDDWLARTPVSSKVNRVSYDAPDLIVPSDSTFPQQLELFDSP